jgi:hypothetical protein
MARPISLRLAAARSSGVSFMPADEPCRAGGVKRGEARKLHAGLAQVEAALR